MAKITIIGTHSYKDKMEQYKKIWEKSGHLVKMPAFDDHPNLDELGICEYNREAVEWADEVHLFWDQRSFGTIFDFGMVFMARKPIHIVYLESKTFRSVMEKYEDTYGKETT